LDKVLELLFGSPWQVIVAIAVYGLFSATYKDLWKSDPARKRWIGYLIQDTWSRRYRDILEHALNWLDARLTPEIVTGEWDPHDRRSAWSYELLNFSFFMAIFYPLVALIGASAVTGEAQRFGDHIILPASTGLWSSLVEPVMLATYFGLFWVCLRRPQMAMGAALLSALSVTLPYPLVVIWMRGWDAHTIGYAQSVWILLFVILFAAMYLGSRVLSLGREFLGSFTKYRAMVWFSLAAAGIPIIIITGYIQPENPVPQSPEEAQLFAMLDRFNAYMDQMMINGMLLTSIIPVFNAFTDFLSSGLTRFLMRRGLSRRMGLVALFDVVAAALIFCAMIVCMLLLLAFVTNSDGSRAFDLSALFADIDSDPAAYWWLYLTFLTPLVPTVLHLGLSAFGIVMQGWPGLRRYLVEALDAAGQGDVVRGRWATRVLTLTMTVSLMAPIVLLGALLEHSGSIGLGMLSVIEGIAAALRLI
jgi:hypothetical protein